jgi:hypothetical protein
LTETLPETVMVFGKRKKEKINKKGKKINNFSDNTCFST